MNSGNFVTPNFEAWALAWSQFFVQTALPGWSQFSWVVRGWWDCEIHIWIWTSPRAFRLSVSQNPSPMANATWCWPMQMMISRGNGPGSVDLPQALRSRNRKALKAFKPFRLLILHGDDMWHQDHPCVRHVPLKITVLTTAFWNLFFMAPRNSHGLPILAALLRLAHPAPPSFRLWR